MYLYATFELAAIALHRKAYTGKKLNKNENLSGTLFIRPDSSPYFIILLLRIILY